MKAIVVMYDSLNRHWLPPYGGAARAPNFSRLAERSVTFDNAYVCSMPCMPARRDFHTGRPNFLHCNWGPLQPFDDSVPALLDAAGVSTHLVTDHYHYFEDGGGNYHTRYSTWEFFRGQEGDPWKGQVAEPEVPPTINGKSRRQDWINRKFWKEEGSWSQVRTFNAGLDFIERNHGEDSWMLQIETFDPHEPFVAPPEYQEIYPRAGEEPVFDWPAYDQVHESPEEIARLRDNYGAVVSLCDAQLGRVLDAMDRYDLWKDTLLIVWTDHGFLLGEHNLWAKNMPNLWNEVAHIPLFVWDPRHAETAGSRRSALVQPSIDLGPTLLSFFGKELTPEMTGRDLAPAIAGDESLREGAVFGYFGMPIHVTDGRHLLIRHAVDPEQPYHIYSWMPEHMRGFWSREELAGAEITGPLPFSKGHAVPRFPRMEGRSPATGESCLFDLKTDPGQENPLKDPVTEARLLALGTRILSEAHVPREILRRYGFPESPEK